MLVLGDVIGIGGTCEVLRATLNGEAVAVKRLLRNGAVGFVGEGKGGKEGDLKDLVKEIGCMCGGMTHPNIVGFLGIVPDVECPLMVEISGWVCPFVSVPCHVSFTL
jgi:hypothetical protein